MKNYLMIACAAVALIGCAHNRGGVGDGSERQTGYDRNYKMPKSESSKSNDSSATNSINSSTSNRSEDQTPTNPTTPQN